MFEGRRVGVVVPARNEEGTIGEVVREFLSEPAVDLVLVVANGCSDATDERAREAGADVIGADPPGYGNGIKAGLDALAERGFDVGVVTEADGSFRARDLRKLLNYLGDCQMVLGTRTTRQMVQQGANMRPLVRWANVVLAKVLEVFWYFPHEPRLTDVGCTYRALWLETWRRMRPGLQEAGPQFSPEMICEAYALGLRVIEIPVVYGARRAGESKHSARIRSTARTGLKMLVTICRKRLLGARR
jgi:glycosyltransferase involved in cell wall biosynthesis